MPDTKISDEASAGALTGTEIVLLVDGVTNARTTTQDIADLATGGGGTPGGSTTQLQYNNAGAFGGAAHVTYNATSGALTISPQTAPYAIAQIDSGRQIYTSGAGLLSIGQSGTASLTVNGGTGDLFTIGNFFFQSAYSSGGSFIDTGVTRSAAATVKITNGSTGLGTLIFKLPTSDPGITGALWNNAGTIAISA